MGFNWGAFAGAAGQSALNTFERLNEQSFRALQRERLMDEIEKERKDKEISGKTFGNVGQETEYGQAIATEGKTNRQAANMLSEQGRTGDPEMDRDMAESAAKTLRENAARQGIKSAEAPMAALKPEVYTEQQAYKDYARQMASIDPKAARAARKESFEMKKLQRDSDLDDKFDGLRDTVNTNLAKIQTVKVAKGMSGLADEAKKAGLPVKYVEGKDGFGAIQVLDAKGKVIQTITSLEDAANALEQQVMKSFQSSAVSLLGSADKVLSYMNQREELGFKGREVAVKEAIAPSEIAKNLGAANYYQSGGRGTAQSMEAKINDVATALAAAEGRTAPNGEDRKKAAQLLTKDPQAKPDDAGLNALGMYRHTDNKIYKFHPTTGQPIEVRFPGQSVTDQKLGSLGFDPFDTKRGARPNPDPRRALPTDIDPLSNVVAP